MTNGKPRLLDLFCGGGGAGAGYARAGFDVHGVDIREQPDYPFSFTCADAMSFPWDGFDVVHASPPCQAFTQMSARYRGKGGKTDSHADLLTPFLEMARARHDLPWVVENVPGSKRVMRRCLVLHGRMFGLRVHRPRLFESNVTLFGSYAPANTGPGIVGVYGDMPAEGSKDRYRNNGNRGKKSVIRVAKSLQDGQAAMGIDWLQWDRLKEAIPPAYTEYIGRQLIAMETS